MIGLGRSGAAAALLLRRAGLAVYASDVSKGMRRNGLPKPCGPLGWPSMWGITISPALPDRRSWWPAPVYRLRPCHCVPPTRPECRWWVKSRLRCACSPRSATSPSPAPTARPPRRRSSAICCGHWALMRLTLEISVRRCRHWHCRRHHPPGRPWRCHRFSCMTHRASIRTSGSSRR